MNLKFWKKAPPPVIPECPPLAHEWTVISRTVCDIGAKTTKTLFLREGEVTRTVCVRCLLENPESAVTWGKWNLEHITLLRFIDPVSIVNRDARTMAHEGPLSLVNRMKRKGIIR